MTKKTFQNPVLSGFYPDPSICRVGDDYYMVTSSFVYFPGLPIFHSRDLVNWEQIGHGIHDASQLDYKNCETSLGLWAPAIRYSNGTYYIINTFVSEGREARRDNYIITAKNPAGPWSKAHFIEGADGIDSSLFFDEDGRIWYTGNFICKEALYEGHHGIYLCELDPETLQFKGERTVIWDGLKSRSKWIEAPHLYRHDGWYYLIVAEGGTFENHCVMMARCKTIDGDYEICPRNPIVSHRHLPLTNPISVVGHADIVETQKGEWWMVLLGIRPNDNKDFATGRETFMIPVIWDEDGWLRVDNENGCVNKEERLPDLPLCPVPVPSACDNFETTSLRWMWNTVHPPKELFYSLEERPGFLRLQLIPEVMNEICTPAFVGRRQTNISFRCTTAMEFTPQTDAEQAGMALIQDDRFHYLFTAGMKDSKPVLQLWKTELAVPTLLHEVEIPMPDCSRIYLTAVGTHDTYGFYYGCQEDELITFYEGAPASVLSSLTNGGFTGAYIGMYATANHTTSDNHADFDWFTYEPVGAK